MSYNIVMFILFFFLSCIPWLISFVLKDKDVQIGLLILDFALSFVAWLYLYWAIGFWWTVFAGLISYGIGRILQGFGMKGYTTLDIIRKA